MDAVLFRICLLGFCFVFPKQGLSLAYSWPRWLSQLARVARIHLCLPLQHSWGSALVQCWRRGVHSSTLAFVTWIPGFRFRFQGLQSKRFTEMLPWALMPFPCSQRKTREPKRSEPVSVSRSTGHQAWLPLQCSSL